MKKDIEPKDSNGRWHGYHEQYFYCGTLWLRCVYKHGKPIGYTENHRGEVKAIIFFIK